MNDIVVRQPQNLIPLSAAELARAGDRIAQALLDAAEQSLEVENPSFREDFNGSEQQGMISQRALKLRNLMQFSLDAAGGELMERLRDKGAYHPDLRSDSQELVDELLSKVSQNRLYQSLYLVQTVFVKAEALGVNISSWLENTTTYKLIELAPEFRFVLEAPEIDEDERDDLFLQIVALTTKTMSEIREAKMVRGPKQFAIYEEEAGDGYEWLLPAITRDTRSWLLRRVQPYGRLRSANDKT